jgi:hypothetical protein
MVTDLRKHQPTLVSPYYAARAECVLHRYLDDEFVTAFLQDAHKDRLGDARVTEWQSDDRMGDFHDYVTLRQPVHRASYLVSVEAICNVPGQPALDPRKIKSAGFVIRRAKPPQTERRWKLVDGVAIGWVKESGDLDPDENRRVANAIRMTLRQTVPEPPIAPAYLGEATSPLHPVVVEVGGRKRTLLYGYVPVGSGVRHAPNPVDIPSGDGASDAEAKELPWPFGLDRTTVATGETGLQVDGGKPTPAFFALLNVLVDRFQIGITYPRKLPDESIEQVGVADNKELEDILSTFHLFQRDPDGVPITICSLKAYLSWGLAGDEPPLKEYLWSEQEAARSDSKRWLSPGSLPGGPARSGFSLTVDADQASLLRAALLRRHHEVLGLSASDIPVPRFAQGEDDVYLIRPFIRVEGECCCEHVVWGPASQRFRVASALDPEAARPVSIILPSFKSLARARPKASFIAPSDLARKLNAIRPDKGLTPDLIGSEGAANALCWIFSFSIPAITICALVVLMIVLNLLNLVFWWLPWVFLRIPVFCKRFLP